MNSESVLSSWLQLTGLFLFVYVLGRLAYKTFNNLGTFYFNLGWIDFKSYGSWAVVTGGTDGIGKCYARKLASRGLNLVLISNQPDQFAHIANEFEKTYAVKIEFINADFTEPISIYQEIKQKLVDLDIGVLVNNVGMLSQPQSFHTYFKSDKHANDIINCNVVSLTKMTALVLPGMIKKKRGVIINICSASGRTPTIMESVYSSTKAYMDFFSSCLRSEYSSMGLIVQSVCPFFVCTKLLPLEPSLTVPRPEEFVESAFKTVGSQPVTNGSLVHNIMGWFCENAIPLSIYHLLAARSFQKINKNGTLKTLKQN